MKVKTTVEINDKKIISKIADRAVAIGSVNKLDVVMYISACIDSGCPLRLEELLEASDGNFCHDVFGIAKNLNMETGKLLNCFSPRYAK